MYLKFSILFVLIFSIILLSWNCLVQCKGGGFRGSSSARSFSSGSSSYGRISSSRSSGSGSFGSYYGDGDRRDDNRNRIWRMAVVIFWCAVFIFGLLFIVFLCWRQFCPNDDCTAGQSNKNNEAKEQEEANNLAHQQQQQRPLMDSYNYYQRDNLHCALQPHHHYGTEKHTWIM